MTTCDKAEGMVDVVMGAHRKLFLVVSLFLGKWEVKSSV